MPTQPRGCQYRHEGRNLRVHLTQVGHEQSESGKQETERPGEREPPLKQTGGQEDCQSDELHRFISVAQGETASDVTAQGVSCGMEQGGEAEGCAPYPSAYGFLLTACQHPEHE